MLYKTYIFFKSLFLEKRKKREIKSEKENNNTKNNDVSIRELVFGFNDGLVTTFTVIAGFTGAVISNRIIIIAALINAISDGLSMAFGAWLSTKSENETFISILKEEKNFLKKLKKNSKMYDVKVLELKEYFKSIGFKGKVLEESVNSIVKNKDRWAEIVVRDIKGIEFKNNHNPYKDSVFMFLAFLFGAFMPIIPYIVNEIYPFNNVFFYSIFISLFIAFLVGAFKTKVTKQNFLKSGFETFFVAALLMVISYYLGVLMNFIVP